MLALRGARLFDGERVMDRATVLIDGGRIVAVGEPIPESVETIELPGATLLPGLVDTHQHLCFDGHGTLEEQVTGIDDDALLERARSSARTALAAGVTTLRDLGDRHYLTLGLRSENGLPTIVCSGPPITREQGHCWYLGGEVAADDEALRGAVRERAERGCDVVKVMATGGAGTPSFPLWESQFSTGELQVIVDEAHVHGLPVAAHCHGTGGIESALAAGVHSIEHCTFFTPDGRSVPDPDLIDRLASSGIALSMSLGRIPGGPPPPPVIAANLDAIFAALTRMVDRGATVCVGTDAGIGPVKPHDVLPHALQDLVSAGVTTSFALRAMTAVAAGVVGMGDRKGHLRDGYDADVLAVDGDPLVDPEALTRTVGVWKAGDRIR